MGKSLDGEGAIKRRYEMGKFLDGEGEGKCGLWKGELGMWLSSFGEQAYYRYPPIAS